jgi:hypothetical protein
MPSERGETLLRFESSEAHANISCNVYRSCIPTRLSRIQVVGWIGGVTIVGFDVDSASLIWCTTRLGTGKLARPPREASYPLLTP